MQHEIEKALPVLEGCSGELRELCRSYGVSRLEVFGSAATGEFREGESDLDFLVEFLPSAADSYADSYFGLLEDLQELFGAPVDLVVSRAIRNPHFRQSVEETKSLIYAA